MDGMGMQGFEILPTPYPAADKDAHEQRGGIAGQREVLKTTTAKRIRDRMIADIRAGAVLPPVVIGVVLDEGSAETLVDKHDQSTLLACVRKKKLSIIDGMQRTASLLEAGGLTTLCSDAI